MQLMIDRIITSVPQSRKDAVALSGGIHYEYNVTNQQALHSETPLPVRRIKKCERMAPGFINCTGKKFGWFTVIGMYAANDQYKGRARWVVRCVCGHYEIRHQKAITKPKTPNDKCYICQHLDYLKSNTKARVFKETPGGRFTLREKGDTGGSKNKVLKR
jgi:hypothetical protein